MNLRSRARSLFGRELSEHAVKASRVDHAVFHDLRARAPKIDEIVRTPPTLKNGQPLAPKVWERLAEDLFSEFYGEDEPALRARDNLDPAFHVNRELAAKQARDDTFRETRAMTRGQRVESALGLKGAMESLAKSYGDELSEHGERENEIAAEQDQIDMLDEQLEALRERRDANDPTATDRAIRELAKVKRFAVDGLKAATAAQAASGGDLIDAATRAVASASKAASASVRATSLLPGSGPGSEAHLSAEQSIQFAERVHKSKLLQDVLEMLGRIETSMGTVRRQLRKGGYEEMVDIEMGDDLRLVLPAEKGLLTHPVAKLDFYRRLHERSLMQYEMWSEQELKRGPIIVGTDGSQSMEGAPNIFARGLTLATCSIGNREHRNTAAIEFGSTGQLREFWFPGDRPLDTTVALDFAEHFYKGGTDINQVLLRAHEMINAEAPFHAADLLIVTDGGDVLTDATIVLRDKLREMGVKIHGICVGIRPTPYMIEVCDAVSSVLDFAGPNSTSDRIAIDLS
jgi:uncharacterized protein with von Willebrand factor type A (vWA) domain